MQRTVVSANLRGGKVDRSSAEDTLVEAPKVPRGVGYGEGVSHPGREGVWEEARPPLQKNLLFDLKMEILMLYLSWI